MSSGLLQIFVEHIRKEKASNNTGILNTCTRLWLTESEQVTLVVSIKDVVRSSRVQQTLEEGRRTYRPKRCGNDNKDEDNSPKTLNDKNQQASSQKFRQQTLEQVRRTYRPKRCGNNNKDEDNSPKTLNDKNQQASSQKFRQQTLEEGRRTYRPKRCGNNNKDEDNSPKTLNDKNQQASSQKFRQLRLNNRLSFSLSTSQSNLDIALIIIAKISIIISESKSSEILKHKQTFN